MRTYRITREDLHDSNYANNIVPIKDKIMTPKFECFRPILIDILREMVENNEITVNIE